MTARKAGFTLIEVLAVLAVLGVLLAVLNQGMRFGLQAFGGFQRGSEPQADMEAVERTLRHMIERMDPGRYPEPPALRGTASDFLFTTELPDPDSGGVMTGDVRLEASGGHLLLFWTPHTHGMQFGAPPPVRRTALLDHVSGLEISYAAKGAAAWRAVWAEPALPGLVRLRIVRDDGIPPWPPIIARPPREQAEE